MTKDIAQKEAGVQCEIEKQVPTPDFTGSWLPKDAREHEVMLGQAEEMLLAMEVQLLQLHVLAVRLCEWAAAVRNPVSRGGEDAREEQLLRRVREVCASLLRETGSAKGGGCRGQWSGAAGAGSVKELIRDEVLGRSQKKDIGSLLNQLPALGGGGPRSGGRAFQLPAGRGEELSTFDLRPPVPPVDPEDLLFHAAPKTICGAELCRLAQLQKPMPLKALWTCPSDPGGWPCMERPRARGGAGIA